MLTLAILDSYLQDDFHLLVKDYEALVRRSFAGKYLGLQESTYFRVFMVGKLQPTDEVKQFYIDISKLIDAKRVNSLITRKTIIYKLIILCFSLPLQ